MSLSERLKRWGCFKMIYIHHPSAYLGRLMTIVFLCTSATLVNASSTREVPQAKEKGPDAYAVALGSRSKTVAISPPDSSIISKGDESVSPKVENEFSASRSIPMKPPSQTKSKVAIFGEFASGVSWRYRPVSYDYSQSPPIYHDGLIPQANVLGGIGVAGEVFQHCSPHSVQNCTSLWVRGLLGGGLEVSNKASYFQILAGLEVDKMWENHPGLAFRFTVDIGYARLFIDDSKLSSSEYFTFALLPSATDHFVFHGGPGLLIHLDPWSKYKGFTITVDLRFYFFGGETGFVIPLGIRYRI